VIDEVSDEFIKIVDRHLSKIIDFAEDDPVRLVRIVRIIEREERAQQEEEEYAKVNPTRITIKRQTTNLRQRCFEAIENNVKKYFKDNLKDCAGLESKLERLSELCDGDLEHIERHVVPCFPKEYNILQRYVRAYDSQVRQFIDKLVQGNISNDEKAKLSK
jgi:exocyst complex component 3